MAEALRTTIGVAIDLPDPWGSELTAARLAAGDPAAAHVPAHVTLLGPTEVAAADLPAIDRHLAAVARRHTAFTVRLRGTGTFRPVTQVVFVAVAAGISECEQLHQAVRQRRRDRGHGAVPVSPARDGRARRGAGAARRGLRRSGRI